MNDRRLRTPRARAGRLLALAVLGATLLGAGLLVGAAPERAARVDDPLAALLSGALAVLGGMATVVLHRRQRAVLAALTALLSLALLGAALGVGLHQLDPAQARSGAQLVAAQLACAWGATWLFGWALHGRGFVLRYSLVGLLTLGAGTALMYTQGGPPLAMLLGSALSLLLVGVALEGLDAILARRPDGALLDLAGDLLGSYPRGLVALFRALVAADR